MSDISQNLTILGILLLTGFAAHAAGRKVHVPRVTLLLLTGLVSGPHFLHILPDKITNWFAFITHMALAIVGFLLGERFYGKDLKNTVAVFLGMSVTESVVTTVFVMIFVFAATGNIVLAVLLAGLSAATDPAATYDVVNEKKASGPLTNTLLGIVALDDAWGIVIFSFILVIIESVSGAGHGGMLLFAGLWQIAGAVLLGALFGVPMAWLTGRIKRGEPTLLEAVGFIFLCGGIALYLEISYLLACMTLGIVVANRAKHHTKPFREIKGINESFLALFFFLAGYNLYLPSFLTLSSVVIIYVAGRVAGKFVGGCLGGMLTGAGTVIQKRIGLCLIPQAGVAVGMALLVAERIPDPGIQILQVVIASTIVFEIVGPVFTVWQLRSAKEIHSK